MTYLCIAPACGKDCDQCREAISPQQVREYAIRYALLRNVPDDKLNIAGVPCIAIPESPTSGNFANKEDADAAIDAALSAHKGAEE